MRPLRLPAFSPAFHFPDRSVKPDQMAGAGANVQVIDVLRDHCAALIPLRPFGNDAMRRVWLTTGNRLPPPLVPLPDERRVAAKSIRRRELLGPDMSPETPRPAKGRHSARGGYAGPRENGEPLGCAHAIRESLRYQDSGVRAGQGAQEPEGEEGARPCRRRCR